MIRNVIFDWSGTLVDDLPAVWRTTNHLLERAGESQLTMDQFRIHFTLPFAEFYSRHLPEHPIQLLESWWHEYFPSVEHLVTPLPQSKPFLEFIKGQDMRTIICSAIHPNQFGSQSNGADFMHLIDNSYVGIRDKVDSIQEIMDKEGFVGEETLFIGDMQHDIAAAHAGKLRSCAVLTGYNGKAQLQSSGPDLIVENLNELKSILSTNSMKVPASDLSLVSHSNSINKQDLSGDALPPRPIATVGALIFNNANEVLMIQTHKWSDLWGIPGGKIEQNESAENALIREILEETQLDICDIEFVMVQDCIQSSEFYKPAHFLLLNYSARLKRDQRVVLNDEAQDFEWLSIEDALKRSLNQPTRILIEKYLEDNQSGNDLEISIEGIEVQMHLGVPDWERDSIQTVYVDLNFNCNNRISTMSDQLDDTVNYAEVASFARKFSKAKSWQLIESYITDLSTALKKQFPIKNGRLEVSKKVLPGVKKVSVSLEF